MKTPAVHSLKATNLPPRKNRPSILTTSVAALLGLGLLAGSAHAQQAWDANGILPGGGGNGNWDVGVSSNWTTDGTGILPPTTWNQGADANFTFGGGGTVTVVGGVQVNDTTFGAAGYTLTGGALTLTGNQPFMNAAAGVTGVVNLVLTGANSVTINGSGSTGTVDFQGANSNTYTGATIVSAGTLLLSKNGVAVIGVPGDLTLNGSSLVTETLGNQIADTSNVALNGTSTFNLNGNTDTIGSLAGVAGTSVTLGAGTLTLAGTTNATFAGVVSGTGAIVKSGTATQTLTGANTYSGLTTVSNGVLEAGNNSALGTAGTGTTVNGTGTLRLLNGINTGAEPLSLSGAGAVPGSGALAVANGGNATVGGPITIAANATITANGGTLNLNGGINKNGTTLTFGNAAAGGGTVNVGVIGGGAVQAITGALANSDLVVESMTVNLNVANIYNSPTTIRSSGGIGTGVLNANAAGALPNPAFGAPARSVLTMDDGTSLGGSVLNLNNGVRRSATS